MKKNLIFLLFVLLATSGFAQQGEIYSTERGAIDGYDPVAFFKDKKPVPGSPKFSYQWNQATWYFASAKNLNAFKANPEKFAPQYGGYCAYGMASGYKAQIDVAAWMIVNNKLYLNYNKEVQAEWEKDKQAMIEKADKNWPEVKTKQ